MPKRKLTERRQAIRAKRILSIQYRLAKARNKTANTRWYVSTTHDMSAIGIAFLSDIPYRIGDILELHTVMSGVIDIVKGFGQVIRVEEKARGQIFLIGIKFVDLKPYVPKKKKPSKTKGKQVKRR